MITRDPPTASRSSADMIVIGGGVYGITLALEAACRGLRPILLERDDFGGRTSWNSLRIVHGGLRYLQRLDLRRFRESVKERRWWLANFPDLVTPLPCLMPLYGRGLRRPAILRMALLADALLGWDRNRRVAADLRLPTGRVLSRAETLERCPWLEMEGLSGGALWSDALMLAPQRLLIEMLHRACEMGAVALNYTEVTEPLLAGGSICGVRAEDRLASTALEFRAPIVVNCGGPWTRSLSCRLDRDVPQLFRPSLAVNLLLDRKLNAGTALALTASRPGSRTYFLLPWQGRILAGTFHAKCDEASPITQLDPHIIEAFIHALDATAPQLEIRPDQVVRTLWGHLPVQSYGSIDLSTRETILHHADHGGPHGLFSIAGVKFTTARLVAERTLRRTLELQNRPLPPARQLDRQSHEPVVAREEFELLLQQDRAAAMRYLQRVKRKESVVQPEDLVLRRHDWGLEVEDAARMVEVVADLIG